MAQYFVDFSGDTLGQPPAGWTLYDFLSTDLEVVSDASARGGQALRLYMSGTSSRRFASYDAAGTAEDSEMLVRFKCADPDYIFPAMMREQGDNMSLFSAYFVQKLNDTLSLRKYVGGNSGNITSSSDPLENTSEWAYVRFRISGNILQVKTWAATESEPQVWDIEVTNTDITGAGRLGIFGYYSAKELTIDSIGFGTNGDAALDSETITQPENITVALSGSTGSTGTLSVSKSSTVALSGSTGSTGTLQVSKGVSVSLSGSSGSTGMVRIGEMVSFAKSFTSQGVVKDTFTGRGTVRNSYKTGGIIL